MQPEESVVQQPSRPHVITVTLPSARQLIPLPGATAWMFASARRFVPWRYSAALTRGRLPDYTLVSPHFAPSRREVRDSVPLGRNLR